MTGKGLWPDKRSWIFDLHRKIPKALHTSFNRGELYKVSLGTSGLRVAEKKFAIANGEYEAKLATSREARIDRDMRLGHPGRVACPCFRQI